MKFITLLLASVCLPSTMLFAQTTWYLSQQSGNDNNSGTTAATPYKTVNKVRTVAQPGDTIRLMGQFKNSSYTSGYTYTGDINDNHIWHAENSLRFSDFNGLPSQYITIKPHDGNTILKGDGANIFRVQNCSYLRIEGFEIQGESANIPLSTAQALQFLYREENSSLTLYRVPSGTSDQVIAGMTFPLLDNISRPSFTDTRGMYFSNVHHIDITGNHIYNMPGGGLRVAECDYINITGNHIHDCTSRSFSGTHGLVVSDATTTSGDNNQGYRIVVAKNTVHHNYNGIYSWSPQKIFITPHIDEGKGISLQRNFDLWTAGRILVVNNITYWNGYSGLHSNTGRRIDFINNTAYKNYYTPAVTYNDLSGNNNIGISTTDGNDVIIVNNVAYTGLGVSNAVSSGNMTNVVVRNNVIYGEINAEADAVDVGSIFLDPLFADADGYDFHLQPTSPAIDAADAAYAPSSDFYNMARTPMPDIGAVEYLGTLPVELAFFNASRHLNETAMLDWMTLSEKNSHFFLLEKSSDVLQWKTLAQLEGHGNTSHPVQYSVIDPRPFAGHNYYRLTQVDFDGTSKHLGIRHLHFIANEKRIGVSPNPVTDRCRLPLHLQPDEFYVYDMHGKNVASLIRRQGYDGGTELDMSLLHPGIYFFYIEGIGSTLVVKK